MRMGSIYSIKKLKFAFTGKAMEDTEEERARESVMIFPYMAKGHTIPLLDLSSALSARGLRVTIVTTPLNSSFLRQSLPPEANPNVDFVILPFPRHPSLPEDCESTDQLPSFDLLPTFLQTTELLREPFRRLLHRLSETNSLPLCVISDFFLGWTLHECNLFRLPRFVFQAMSVFSMLLCKSIIINHAHLSQKTTFNLPGTPPYLLLSHADVPYVFRSLTSDDPFLRLSQKNGEAEGASCGVLVDSFSELDGKYVPFLEAFYKNRSAKAWLVGPLCLRRSIAVSRHPCLEWLDKQAANSVIYVAFGTQAHVSKEQMEELVKGLEMSGSQFLLAAKAQVPALAARGLIVNGWAPQREILASPSTGGFLSHCGWNSLLESLAAGLPILAWPLIADQTLSTRLVVDELGIGLRVGSGSQSLVGREEICEAVKELMGGERGDIARKKAKELGKMAVASVAHGGSSDIALTKWVEEIRRVAHERTGAN